jgi:diguanylate cyclase (GGDEF)-like protein/PAS domain S-box-containing protein
MPCIDDARVVRRALVVGAALTVAYAATSDRAGVNDLGLLAAGLASATACLVRGRRAGMRAWTLTGIGLLTWSAAQAAWAWSEGALLAELGFAVVLPLVVASAVIIRAPSKGRDLLDLAAVLLTAAAGAWAFVSPAGADAHAALAVAHPLSFVAASALALYLGVRKPAADTTAAAVAAAGMLLVGLANLQLGRRLGAGTYEPGLPLDVVRFGGLLLIGVGAVVPDWARFGRRGLRESVLVAAPFLPVSMVLAAPILFPPAGGLGFESRFALLVGLSVVFVRQHQLLLDNRRLARAMEAKLNLASTSGGIGTWEWDPVTNEVVWSDELRRLLNLPPDAPATFEAWIEAVHPEDRARVAALTEDDAGITCRVQLADGSVRHVLTRRSDREPNGRYLGVMLDVTALRAADARVVETLESIGDAYFALDDRWRCTFVNRRAAELIGRPRTELVGRVIWDVLPDLAGSELERQLRAAARQEGPQEVVATWFGPDRRCYAGRVHPLAEGGVAAYLTDVQERVAAEAERERLAAELVHQAVHDPLTGLANRIALADAVSTALATTGPMHLLFIDLDRCKVVNDSLGHAAGDRLLVTIARRLAAVVGPEDLVARIGGDEFVVSLRGGDRYAAAVAERILDAVRAPIEVDGQRLFATASIGVASAIPGGDAAELLRDADIALYRAKAAGRDQVAWFDEAARGESVRRLRLEVELRRALESEELVLHYQPSFDLASGHPTGAEALMRWQHPTEGLLLPGAFIPLAEEAGLIDAMGVWALREAVAEARRRLDAERPITIWVNVSARQLVRPGFAALVRAALEEASLPSSLLGVEVTESVLADVSSATAELAALRAFGVRIAIDDFGTGYSSLARLRALPVDVLKIDRSFVVDLTAGDSSQAVVAAIVELAGAIGAATVAEGVEHPEQLSVLRAMGCDAACGFHLGRPAASTERPRAA